jgi:hypothetical protein
MADVAEPGVCQACGRPLPAQTGRGRARRYCDARCRSAARRRRGRPVGGGSQGVKKRLTSENGQEYLDTMDGVSSADDPVAVRVADTARRLVEEVTLGTSPGDVVAAARDLSAAAETALQTAVDRAWAAGHSWREIGDVLGISRQAAFQRFGHPVDPRTGEPMTRAIPPDVVEQVTGFLARFTAGRWEQVLGDFNEFMRERHDVNRLASGWAHMIGMFGSYQGSGEVSPVLAGDSTVADVLLRFEAGEAMLWARFDRDGKISGLRLHPASPLPGKDPPCPSGHPSGSQLTEKRPPRASDEPPGNRRMT